MSIDALVEGITIGASAGLISGVVLALLQWFKNKVQANAERREQIRHLVKTIEHSRDLIYSAFDLDFTDHPVGRMIPKNEVQKSYLQELHREVQNILTGRASRLSFDEIHQIKQAFGVVDLYPDWIPNEKGYEGIFGHLQSIEWLRLRPSS